MKKPTEPKSLVNAEESLLGSSSANESTYRLGVSKQHISLIAKFRAILGIYMVTTLAFAVVYQSIYSNDSSSFVFNQDTLFTQEKLYCERQASVLKTEEEIFEKSIKSHQTLLRFLKEVSDEKNISSKPTFTSEEAKLVGKEHDFEFERFYGGDVRQKM